MRLFIQRGFARVTVADVAHEAGVSEKTVFNYFPTKEDLFFDEVDEREAALVAAIRGRKAGESVVTALRRLQVAECPRLCSPGFAIFARIIEESAALQAKELEVMARLSKTLATPFRDELRVRQIDAETAATMPAAVHRLLFHTARAPALAGRRGPTAVRRFRSDLERAYRFLE